MPVDPRFQQYATPTQWAAYVAADEYGSAAAAERALGKGHSAISTPIRRMKAYAASKGYAPDGDMTHPVPDGFVVKGVSTYYDSEGQPRGQWVKSTVDAEAREEALRARLDALKDELPRYSPVTPPGACDTDLLTIYPAGDPHFGLYASADETGQRYDLAEAERVHCQAIDRLIESTPRSAVAIFNDKGDTTHADNNKNRTPRSGHYLDVDGRHTEAVRANMRSKRHTITRLLEKHQHVIVRIDPGNHDPETALQIALMLGFCYENEPRVDVVTTPNPFWYHAFGRNLIGTVHGDGAKGKDLPLVMASDQPEAWGQTEFRLWIVGHVHHKDVKEYAGCTVEYVRTLAASDSHAHGQGYRSKRDMQAITLHREFGEVERHTCSLTRINRCAA